MKKNQNREGLPDDLLEELIELIKHAPRWDKGELFNEEERL